MNVRRFLSFVICYPSAFLFLAACGTPQPAPTPFVTPIPQPSATPSVSPTEAVTEWTYVALGDSEAICCGKRSYP